LFAGFSEGSILAVCLLFSQGLATLTNHVSISEKKQVMFVGSWLFVSVFLNDLFRGFFLFALLIAYISLYRIVFRRCSSAIIALKAAARNARNLQNNVQGALRMELKVLFFRSLLVLLMLFVAVACIMLVIVAFVPYVKDAYVSNFVLKDALLFVVFCLFTIAPRLLQWRFNYTLEHEIADQLPQQEQFTGVGILAGIFQARNFRCVSNIPFFFFWILHRADIQSSLVWLQGN
jgi:hypothetical protein